MTEPEPSPEAVASRGRACQHVIQALMAFGDTTKPEPYTYALTAMAAVAMASGREEDAKYLMAVGATLLLGARA